MKSLLGFVLAFGIAGLLLVALGPQHGEDVLVTKPDKGSVTQYPEKRLFGKRDDRAGHPDIAAKGQESKKVSSHVDSGTAGKVPHDIVSAEEKSGTKDGHVSLKDRQSPSKDADSLEGVLDEDKARNGLAEAEAGKTILDHHVDQYTSKEVLMIAKENAEMFEQLERRMLHH